MIGRPRTTRLTGQPRRTRRARRLSPVGLGSPGSLGSLVYLERFVSNALVGERNKLQGRYLLAGVWHEATTPASSANTPTSRPVATPTSKIFRGPLWKRNDEPESLVPLSREQVREQVANVQMEAQ